MNHLLPPGNPADWGATDWALAILMLAIIVGGIVSLFNGTLLPCDTYTCT